MCAGSWNCLLHMSSLQSGVSNIYSQTSEATTTSYLHPKPPEDLPELQMDNQEKVKHTNKDMVLHTNQDMVMHTNLEMANTLPLSLTQNSELLPGLYKCQISN
jgi:hypothetical protein